MATEYDYPYDLNLAPDSKLHVDLVDGIKNRALLSHGSMAARFETWRELDRMLTTYVALTTAEEKRLARDPRSPVTIVFPVAAAILDTLLSYITGTVLEGTIFKYRGSGPEDEVGAALMEKIIESHVKRFSIPLSLHTVLRDDLVYGFGVSVPTWQVLYGHKFSSLGEGAKVEVEDLLFEGNCLHTIDPYTYLPDPGVPVDRPQDGEFAGWVERTNYMTLLERERAGFGFNCQYLKREQASGTLTGMLGAEYSARAEKTGVYASRYGDLNNPVDVIHMYVRLVPKDWELGSGEYPEVWYFQLAGSTTIIYAARAGVGYGAIPVQVSCTDFDGHSQTPVSRIERLYGLQTLSDWLLNSRIQNVRKTINGTLFVDPSRVNLPDLEDAKAGGIVRMRPEAFGQPVENCFKQILMQDVTASHIGDAEYAAQLMKAVAGASDAMMGVLRQGGPERLTGQEFQGTASAGVNRLDRLVKVFTYQTLLPLGLIMAAHTQQYMSKESYVDAVGRWEDLLVGVYGSQKYIKVTPPDLNVNYDLDISTASLPGKTSVRDMMELFKIIAQDESLRGQFDVQRIFKKLAVDAGWSSVDQFVNTQVMGTDQVAQQAQAGNIVPINEMLGGMNGNGNNV